VLAAALGRGETVRAAVLVYESRALTEAGLAHYLARTGQDGRSYSLMDLSAQELVGILRDAPEGFDRVAINPILSLHFPEVEGYSAGLKTEDFAARSRVRRARKVAEGPAAVRRRRREGSWTPEAGSLADGQPNFREPLRIAPSTRLGECMGERKSTGSGGQRMDHSDTKARVQSGGESAVEVGGRAETLRGRRAV